MITGLKKSFLAIGGSATLAFSIVAPANAITFDFSGQFGNTSSCKQEGPVPPGDFPCGIQTVAGSSFSGSIDVDDNGRSILPIKVQSSSGILPPFFAGGSINLDSQAATLSLRGFPSSTSSEDLTLRFLPPATLNLTEPFGSFLGGIYNIQVGASLKTFQSINIASATITRVTPPVSVPEASAVPGLFACFGLGWLIQKKTADVRR